MSEVKRYSIAGTTNTPPGWHDYVLASDYDALIFDRDIWESTAESVSTQLEEVLKENARLKAAIANCAGELGCKAYMLIDSPAPQVSAGQ